MRAFALVTLLFATSTTAQVRVDGTGVRTPGVRVDSSGVHTGNTDVTSRGVSVGRGGGTTIDTNGQHRSVSCGGGALTVNGNRNDLTISDCSRVTIAGNSNVASVDYRGPRGSLFVPGNRNSVRWHAGARTRVSASAPGTKNSVSRR